MQNESSRRAQSRSNKHPPKERIDVLLAARGRAASRERAQALLLAGQVRVNSVPVTKAGARVPTDARIEVIGESNPYASRGGLKLEGALDDFGISAQGTVCIDVGSSTGGFTDCLLQLGARKVFAVDVSTDQLAWRLRQDPRVVPVERNARYLQAEDIGGKAALVVVDVSFISVAKVLPAIVRAAGPGVDLLVLIKPQFELERRDVGKGGIVRDPELHRKAIEHVTTAARAIQLQVLGVRPSRVTGAQGNQEFFMHARRPPVSEAAQ